MKSASGWAYAPYKPLFFDSGDIYICRIVPGEKLVRAEWLAVGENLVYRVYFRERECGGFLLAGETSETWFEFNVDKTETDYEFYVETEDKKSRIRLARTGKAFGVTVNYLHPDDEAYSFSGKYLCSPSLIKHPDGYLLASMDLYAGAYPQNLTLIYRSDDGGNTWYYVSELFPCFWGKMFVYENDIYMLANSTEYGDLLIGKSSDGGKTFTKPVTLMYGGGGKNGEAGVHKNPQPIVEYGGRIWNTLEWGSWGRGYHAAMVMSAPVGCDLLDAENWSFSEPVKYNPQWEGVPEGESSGNIEGSLAVLPDGKLYNIMRYDMTKMTPNYGLVIAYEVDTENHENPLKFAGCIKFPANHSKFEIKYDGKSGKYYSIASRITDSKYPYARNLLSLMVSEDGENWSVAGDIISRQQEDPAKVGFQYVDFEFDGDDIVYLCRTAMNNAHNFHDANYSVFGRIKNFRDIY